MERHGNKKALIIGSNSFLGRELSEQLLAEGHQVTGVYREGTENLEPSMSQVAYTELSHLKTNFDWVFLVAAYIPKKTDKEIKANLQKTNIDLVDQVIKTFSTTRIVFCSSVSVYEASAAVRDEKSALAPATAYGKSKLAGEQMVARCRSYAIVRFSSIFGCRMRPTTFLPRIALQALTEHHITLFGNGTRKQNYIAVADAAKYLIKAAKAENNGVYLAVSEQSVSNLKVAEVIQEALPDTTIKHTGTDTSPSFCYDNAATRKALGIVTHRSFKNAIDTLITCLKNEL
ncbi:NAD-dependent epimerase/dehydratase family protein [Altibacter sp. HG106]|uniref:NAD-dependent epimerase/dehydratase family protein n=1 Tax=Altibacter sp. HG106 TaxID=3023937 RepID=UPI00234FEC95|nr:NAD(P)-dependent oxidoreductase [Altibacter sp. HG106]MDC7995702.1 NAD(P)-dependent oxidoreductase [Altibacter sp. HG106]